MEDNKEGIEVQVEVNYKTEIGMNSDDYSALTQPLIRISYSEP